MVAAYSGFFWVLYLLWFVWGLYLFFWYRVIFGGLFFLLVVGLRGYLFTDRERLRAWLESGAEDDGTRMLFVSVRRNLNRITGDVGLLVAVARRLQREGRWMGRARLPRDLARAVRRLEEGVRLRGRG